MLLFVLELRTSILNLAVSDCGSDGKSRRQGSQIRCDWLTLTLFATIRNHALQEDSDMPSTSTYSLACSSGFGASLILPNRTCNSPLFSDRSEENAR